MSVYEVEGGWRYISPVEERAFRIDISSYPNELASIGSTTLFDTTSYDNISQVGGSPLTGTSTHSDVVITTQKVDG